MIRSFLCCCLLVTLSIGVTAQVELIEERFAFEPDLPYDANIPSPESFLGYELGETFTIYNKVVQYFEKLAASSDKITLNQYGQSYEGRPLINVVITSTENQQNIDQIRSDHFKLCDPRKTAESDAQTLIDQTPVFSSLSYNIHGNEASCTESVMQVAYRLVAATDDATQDLLNNSVINLYVCINPDGRDRYVYWYNGVARSRVGVEPRDLEHYEPWPGGRTNHYWFDLNRDWIWRIHPESQGHTSEYQNWLPNIHVDYHEQGYNSNYFTSPGTTPRNLLLPDTYDALTDTFGRANIAEFDKHQISYFTRDVFDFFYPGYGSSYPAGFGAVAMLTEQGGIGAGRAIETSDGSLLKFRQRIFDHYTTSIATLKKAAQQRQLFRKNSYEMFKHQNSKSPTKAYILPNVADPYLEEVIQILLDQKVEVHQANGNITVNNAKDFATGKTTRKQFKQGDYFILTSQPRHLFINSIMERNLAIEDSVMYDMSTWSAPLAYNLEAYSTETVIGNNISPISSIDKKAGKVNKNNAHYAYVINWDQRNAPRALAKLWEKGYRVRSALEGFSDGKADYPPGSLIVLKGRNLEKKDQIMADMTSIAKECSVQIDGFNTGRMKSGYDLASSRNRPVKQPKIALLVDQPFSSYTCGQIYYLFDQETQLPIQRIRTSILKQTSMPKFRQRYGAADLDDFDVLILAGGGNQLKEVFSGIALRQLKEWVNNGGVLIATESAAEYFTKKRSKFTNVEIVPAPKDTSQSATLVKYEDRTDYFGKKRIPGSALKTIIDNSNPLAFGLKDEVYGLKFGNVALKPTNGFQTVGRYGEKADELLIAGYASNENLTHLAGNTFAGVQPMGQGKVVFLLDNTQYRMFWRGPSRMMQNAVMLLKSF